MRADRLVGMILTLLHRERVGAQELAELFEVSPRTVYRDIEDINMAGIPIRSVPGVGGGFEIMPAYKVDKSVFSTAELSAILMGLSPLSGAVRGEALTQALAKIKGLIPADRAEETAMRADQIRIDLSPWAGGPAPHLQAIRAAIEDRRLLSFAYTAHHGNETVRTVEPYQLVWKSGRWYVYGYCRSRGDCRLFRLSRMADLQIEAETFVPRDYPKPLLDPAPVIEAMQTEIKLRIHRSVLDRVLEFCPPDHFAPDGDTHYLVDFPFIENDYYYDILLSFGDKCECLAPPRVRAGMAEKLRGMAAIYRQSG